MGKKCCDRRPRCKHCPKRQKQREKGVTTTVALDLTVNRKK